MNPEHDMQSDDAKADASKTRAATESDGKTTQADDAERPVDDKDLNIFQVISSVFAAGLGVQSSKNRERDFKQGRAGAFIIAGLLFTALFIGTVYAVVSVVLSSR